MATKPAMSPVLKRPLSGVAARFASAIRTNLCKLARAEIDVLTRHAGALLTHRLQTYMPELLGA